MLALGGLMMQGPNIQNEPVTAATLRERALRARRLSRGWLTDADRRLFIDLANRLEAEAAELESAVDRTAIRSSDYCS